MILNPRRRPKSLASAMRQSVVVPVLVVAAIGVPLGTAEAVHGAMAHRTDVSLGPAKPPVPTPAAILIHEHDCWTGEQPADMAGRLPGHVVATLPTGRTVYSHHLISEALDQTFNHTDHHLTIHAYCR